MRGEGVSLQDVHEEMREIIDMVLHRYPDLDQYLMRPENDARYFGGDKGKAAAFTEASRKKDHTIVHELWQVAGKAACEWVKS